MEIQLPQGTGPVKVTKKYSSMTPNQKFIYDKVYDPINGPIFFAENCIYVNRNGIVKYEPFEYQREMIFNMHHYNALLSMFGRQCGKCVCGDTKVKIRSKKTGEEKEITIKELFDMVKE